MDPYLNPALSEVLVPAQETGSSWPKSMPCSCLVLNKLSYYRAGRQQMLHSDEREKGPEVACSFLHLVWHSRRGGQRI